MLRIVWLVVAAFVLAAVPARAQGQRELVLQVADNIIEVTLNGAPVRLEVTAEAFGAAVINPDVAERLALVPDRRSGWRFGPVSVEGRGAQGIIGFGHEAREVTVVWADSPVSTRADGMIGIHHLPYDRVTLALRASQPGEVVERLALKRVGRLFGNTRIGAPIKVGKRELLAIFVPEFTPHNLVTAPTATFLATHLDGGFTKEPASTVNMRFGVIRPVRTMLLAQPLEIGSLAVTRFAVRYEDYGSTAPVGEVAENDPRFEKGRILVSGRKGQGRPDLLTRIGAEQLGACSRLTYDLAASVIELACAPEAG
jgi:hypothetical protein